MTNIFLDIKIDY